MVGTTNSLGLEVDSQNSLRVKRALDKVFELLVSLAAFVVVLHVVKAGKLSLGNEGVPLCTGILVGSTNDHGEDVGLAVLDIRSASAWEESRLKELTFC